jgi:hypothetical protein
MCEWGVEDPWTWGDNIAQSWRMAGDHTGNWDSTKSVIRASAAIPANGTGRPYGWNDVSATNIYLTQTQSVHAHTHTPNRKPQPDRVPLHPHMNPTDGHA